MTCTVTYTARARRDLTGLPPICANFSHEDSRG
jgi:hypothetical protein